MIRPLCTLAACALIAARCAVLTAAGIREWKETR